MVIGDGEAGVECVLPIEVPVSGDVFGVRGFIGGDEGQEEGALKRALLGHLAK
jgi:hypothetical protein